MANLLTEGSGMNGFTAGDAVRQICDAIGRPVDVVIQNAAGRRPTCSRVMPPRKSTRCNWARCPTGPS